MKRSAIGVGALVGLGLAAGLGLVACGPPAAEVQYGTAPPPPPPQPMYSGHYSGPGRLDFAVTRPVVREMPPEQHYGSADVYDSGGSMLTLDVRMFEGGTACRLQASRTPGGGQIHAGQRCLARMTYDGAPVDVEVQVNEGSVSFTSMGVVIGLRGPFVAEVHTGRGTFGVAGIAVWRFQGNR